ncbi:c-type cytochrome biogenesis protein CcmI [Parapusillimonas sp. JC17]|uniref:c-type cytochrome biogenesis protein CcmI n=1 Tax=Parapusillimonas sp. JC17 TaxID=3445768 RepID=UPI003FA1201D
MSLLFAGIVSLLCTTVALWLGRALWRGPGQGDEIGHHSVNATVLRDQLAELEGDVANRTLSEHDFSVAKQELQRRALDEAIPGSVPATGAHNSRRAAAVVGIVLPVAALLVYAYLGSPAATRPAPAPSAATMTQADVQKMVESLEARLKENPDDPEGWLMLGRSYRYFGRYADAAQAFSKAAPIIEADPLSLAEYAEVIARSSASGFTQEATRLLDRALTLDPDEPFALTLAGRAAFERGEYQAAIGYWQQLLEQFPAGSEAAQAVLNGIDMARRSAGAASP